MKRNYRLGIYEKALPADFSWKEKLEAAKAAGYDFLEISVDETEKKLARLDWTGAERLELIRTMKEAGLPIRSMCLSGHRKYPLGSSDPRTAARGMQIMEKAIQLADDLGIRIIQLAGYDVYYEESTAGTQRLFAENLELAVRMAAEAGVLLGFETMETEFMNTVEKAMRFVRRIDSPYLGVYPDMGNITNAADTYGTDVLADIRSGRGHLMAGHLKEALPGKFREIPFGSGHVDFEAVIAETWKLGVRRYVTEFWDRGNHTWKNDVDDAITRMRAILDRQPAAEEKRADAGQERDL